MKNGVKPHAVFSTKNKSKDPKETHANTIKDEHLIPENELLIRLQTDPVKGLTYAEAASRLERDGKNELTPPKKQPEIVSYLLEMVKGFGPLMMCAAGLSLLAYLIQVNTENAVMDSFYVFIVLVAIIILGGTLGYIQKHRSEKIMESFKTIIAQNATVMRNGGWESISAAELVIGDIVEIRAGERIPADLRVMSCTSLKVDNSALTGEVDPLMRNTERNEDVMESKNMCFNGTYAVEGQGQCIVLRTGDDTFIGQIAKLASDSTAELTPIGREIQHCVLVITYIAVIMGLAFCITAFALGVNWLLVVTLSIGLIAGNLPGGLLIMVTIMLSTTAKRMASRNCLVKNLEAVETLGSCSVICSDKTGTLTQNRMTVSRLWVDEQIFHNDTPNDPIGAKSFGEKSPSMPDLLCITGLCNRAKFKADEKSRCKSVASRPVIGDASESALLKLVEVISGDATSYRKANKVVAEIPFNSTNKFQVSIHLLRDTKRYLLVMKGAPERLLELCSTVAMNGEDVPRDAAWEQEYNQAYLEFGRCGERVLGFCDYHLPENLFPYPYAFDTETYNFPLVGLRFVGLISLMDPPRATVPEAVRKCREAGIRVIMVTGDHPLTAKAIARQVGILSADAKTVDDLAEELSVDVKDVNPQLAKAAVITGLQLRDLTNDQLDKVLATHQEIVFARTSPVQKQIIVEACQRGGAIVAVTGDGVNDAPALKKANIGISMGITGSAVSEQAADMVLLDDNFASIVGGVEEGRLIFDNIKKTCCYAMTTDVPEIVPTILYIILSIPLGLYTISMILLNCVTDLMPAISLAFEGAENDIMRLPPRKPNERLISGNLLEAVYCQIGIIESVGAFYVYFVIYGACGWWPKSLIGIRADWEDGSIMDLPDSYGQEWNPSQRKNIEHVAQSGFFISVVMLNIFHLICRTCRRVSIFRKGLKNKMLYLAMFTESAIACFFVYTPVLRTAIGFDIVWPVWILAMIPFGLYLFTYDELRRLMIRKFPKSWWEKELYV